MVVERQSASEVAVKTVRAIRLDPESVDLASPEALAGLLRRTASFTCPTTQKQLLANVLEPLHGILDITETRAELEILLEGLVGCGDLVEMPVVDEESGAARRLLFLGPPAYVRRASGLCVVIGVRPDGADILGDELLNRIQHDLHIRKLDLSADPFLEETMAAEGLQEISNEHWLRCPSPCSAEDVIFKYVARIEASGPSGDIEAARIIDPKRPVNYYRGRWRSLQSQDNGRFVGRRPQAFGADLWCYLETRNGQVVRFIDLPINGELTHGCDEAWRLQAAIDRLSGAPQFVKVKVGEESGHILNLFGPVPSWGQRRLDIVGRPIVRRPGALSSYEIAAAELDEEMEFLTDMMWMDVETS